MEYEQACVSASTTKDHTTKTTCLAQLHTIKLHARMRAAHAAVRGRWTCRDPNAYQSFQPRLSAARGSSQLGTLRCRRWVFLACPHLFTSARVTTVRHSCHLPLLRSPKAEQMVL